MPGAGFLEQNNKTRPSAVAGTVLVVEDDRAVRYLFTQVLRGHGYVVVACADGARGLELARAQIDRIDAIVTDARMPGIDGRELVAQIRPLRPALPILVVSGTLDESVVRANTDPATRYLVKPVSPDRLILELRRAIDAAVPGNVR